MKNLILLVYVMALTLPASAAHLNRQQQWEIMTAAIALEEAVAHFYRRTRSVGVWQFTEDTRKFSVETSNFYHMIEAGVTDNYQILRYYEVLDSQYIHLRGNVHKLAGGQDHILNDWDLNCG